MPLILPAGLPAEKVLHEDNIFTMTEDRATTQDIRPLQILIVNLMPTKIQAEIQFARVLSNTALQVQLTFLRMGSHVSKNTAAEHLAQFYTHFEDVKGNYYDGMILTGAPVETLPFEQVDYWDELCEILDWANKHVYSSIFICWGAQAALYHYYGIDKHPLPKKLSGIFETKTVRRKSPLMRGFDDVWYSPHSRNTTTDRDDILAHPELRILAESDEAGVHIVDTEGGRRIFITGHEEYGRNTLRKEYFRDLEKDPNTEKPLHYFTDDDPEKEVVFRWRAHGSLLFSNWLNYYVYQQTPYDITQVQSL